MKVLVDRSGLVWGGFEARIYIRSLTDSLKKLDAEFELSFIEPRRFDILYARRIGSMLKNGDYALFHGIGPFVPKGFEGATLLSVPDMSAFAYPGDAGAGGRVFRRYMSSSIAAARRVLVPSPLVRRELLRRFKYPARWVDCVPAGEWPRMGIGTAPAGDEGFAEALELRSKAALCVCSSARHKNWALLIEAFGRARRKAVSDWTLVMAFVDRIPKAIKSGHAGWLKPVQTDDETELSKLYSLADLFLYPSLYDGFPYLLVAAMKRGIPSLASRTSSTRELIKGGARLVDARSFWELNKWIERLLNDEELRAEIGAAGTDEARKFSWAEHASSTYDIYRRIAGVGWL